jgi:hypothetical protein
MRIDVIRLVLKQHRFELLAGLTASCLVAVAGALVSVRLAASGVAPHCVGRWLIDEADGRLCAPNVEAYVAIFNNEAPLVFAAMAVLPFAVGLLSGVPVVGKEIEMSTAQTAWSIAPSRIEWLRRQAAPILLLLGAAIGLAAISSEWLEQTRLSAYPQMSFSQIGVHGPLVLARALGAFGLGLVLGALTGRTLSAFVMGGVLSLVLVFAIGLVRQGWADSQPLVPVVETGPVTFDGIVVEQGWQDPTGITLRYQEGLAIAHSFNPSEPEIWLLQQGYRPIQLGLTAATAALWEPIETSAWLVFGSACLLAGALVVNHRRPV